MAEIDQLVAQLQRVKDVFFLSGAGISVASGIPPFRGTDPDAVWNQDVMEKGTFSYFRNDPLGSWTWYLDRFSSIFNKNPNPAHFATASLKEWFEHRDRTCTIVTQNIDGLHKTKESLDVIEIHGTGQRLRCANSGCVHAEPTGSIPFPTEAIKRFKEEPFIQNIPYCSECGDFLRPHVLWFDEYYTAHRDYRYQEFHERLYDTELCICVGTSFSVGITYAVVQHCTMHNIPLWVIDLVPPQDAGPHIHYLEGRAEELLPAIVNALDI
jgi:NAD-dependent deacetylase